MRILVTGGLGFIGSNFIHYVLSTRKDYEVVNIDVMSIGANPENLRDFKNDMRYTFVKGDICDQNLLASLVKEIDVVVNFAAETHVDRSIADPWPFVHSNILGVYNILESMKKYNKHAKLIHISTDEVYGETLEGSFSEEDRLKPSNPYSATKASADMLCMAYYRTYGLNVSVTRCTNNFGPYQFPEKFIPKTIIRALMNLPVSIYGSGENIRDWIYVRDHCEAILLVAKNGLPGEIYNISSGEEIKNIELVKIILSVIGKPENLIFFVEDRPGHDLRYSLESTKIRRELGWKPKHTFKEALEKTVKWYLDNEWWWRTLISEQTLHPTPWKMRDSHISRMTDV